MTELFNETTFLITSYHMMLFSSAWAYDIRDLFGKTMIASILIMIVTNYGIIIAISIRDLRFKFKMWYFKKKKAHILKDKEVVMAKIYSQ